MNLLTKVSDYEEESFLEWMFINRTLEEKGEDWLVAALVDGSIGYYSPNSGRILVEEFKRGQTQNYSERCIALYECDLLKEMLHDIRSFKRREEYDEEGTQRLIKKVREARCSESENEIGIHCQSYS